MRTLFARLSVALLVVIAMIGTGFIAIYEFSTQRYYEELTQRLNAPIAGFIIGDQQLLHETGVDHEALATLAHHAMVIHPSIEIYLLDPDGNVLAHDLPAQSVARERVDVAPIRTLLSQPEVFPIRGDDPRRPERQKIFSAAELRDGGRLQGYLYVVLGGELFDSIAGAIRGGYAQRATLLAIAALLAIGLVAGLLIFAVLTRRLRRLTAFVERVGSPGFDPPAMRRASRAANDELADLELAFDSMTERIHGQLQRLENADSLRRQLISNVSHDLRTPLASMQGYVDTLLIRNGSLSEKQRRDYLLIARRHTHRLKRLISDLFELSRLESGNISPEFEPFLLAELLHDTVQEFMLPATRKGIAIRLDVPTHGTDVYADIGLVQRVLENLLRNALQFTPTGGSVRITVTPRDGAVSVRVADTGCGIAPTDLPHVFDRAYRRGHPPRANGASTSAGLGLAIVKGILDLHGSRISVDSIEGRGTTFRFDLSRQCCTAARSPASALKTRSQAGGATWPGSATAASEQTLNDGAVDDNPGRAVG